MLYRITLDLACSDYGPIGDIYDKAMDLVESAVPINPGDTNEELPHILVQICYHDEATGQPCQVLHQWPS